MPISNPKVTLNIIPAEQVLSINARRVLIVGQMISGTATAGEVLRDVDDATNVINAAFGARSILAEQVREFKKINKLTALDVLPLADNGSAVAATAQVTFTGTATESGTLIVTFGSDKRYRTKVSINSGDTATAAGAAVTAAYAVYASSPFTVADATGTVTATASNGGTHANDWTVRVEGSISGISYSVTGWNSGAADPSLVGVLDVLGSVRYNTVQWPAVYDITTIAEFLDARFNVSNNILDGVCIQVHKSTLSSAKAYVAPLNSQSTVVFSDKTINATNRKGTMLREMPDITAAQVAAIRALRLTDGGNLTQYLTTVAALDQFGGPHLGSLPYFNTALPNLPIPLPEDEYSFEDQDELSDNGISLIGANNAYNGTILGDVVTTYLTDNAGNIDTSYKYLNTVDTESIIRETFFLNYKDKYAQSRLTNGALEPGIDMASEETIAAFSLEIYVSLSKSGLTQSGGPAERDFLNNLSVVLDLASGTATINMAPLLVSQLRAFIGTIQVNFGGKK